MNSINTVKLDKLKSIPFQVIPILFLIVYVLFPTHNSTVDGYGYACHVKFGEALFQSHHLLYSFLGYLWYNLFAVLGFSLDVLSSLIIMNALSASVSLILLGYILMHLFGNNAKALSWIFFVGSTWGVMRFATENETYLVPIVFSLAGSLFYLKYLKFQKTKLLLFSGSLAAIACLFHQIHFFWWLALFVGLLLQRKIMNGLVYAIPALVVPVGYMLAAFVYYSIPVEFNSFLQFVLRDFYSGHANIETGLTSVLFTSMSFFRTFLQVHGYIFVLLKNQPFYILGLAIPFALFLAATFSLRSISFTLKIDAKAFITPHIIAFLLHFIFAFISSGNAEFMVMLPFLMALTFPFLFRTETRAISYMASGMLVWNIVLGVLPLHTYVLDSSYMVANKVLYAGDDTTLFICNNKPHIQNIVLYNSGNNPLNVVSGINSTDETNLKESIESLLEHGVIVYTDCLYRPKTLSRASIITGNRDNVFDGFSLLKIDSVETISGRYFLIQVKINKENSTFYD